VAHEAVDSVRQEASTLSKTDIRKAMEVLETAIAKGPTDLRSAPYYLCLGRLKKEYENYQRRDPGPSEEADKRVREFTEYVKARPGEYFYDEPSGEYFYTGLHFQELVKRFPESTEAIEGAYEMTNLSQGGECEGDIVCPIAAGFSPVFRFLLFYPDSPHTAEAAKRADNAFRESLWGPEWKTDWTEVKDPNQPTEYYDPKQLQGLVSEYEGLAEKLAPQYRPRIYETVAYYHAKFGETEQARQLYSRILEQAPKYENIVEVKEALKKLR
jgi:tetratricopeptide (TPR) repeat protein